MNIRYGLLLAGLSLTALPALAGNTDNGTKLNGPHYNLNIIGVENPKKADMTGSNRHTIFVPLVSKTTGKYSKSGFAPDGSVISGTAIVDSKIWLTPGEEFKVCDGNGFDLAYGCDDSFDTTWNTTYYLEDGTAVPLVEEKQGAVFQLPCNTNLPQAGTQTRIDTNNDGVINKDDGLVTIDYLIGCNQVMTQEGQIISVDEADVVPTLNYAVWARALGTPGGSATVTTCATVAGELQCSLENTVQTRSTGKSSFTDVTNELTSLVISYCNEVIDPVTGACIDGDDGGTNVSVTYERIALFAGDTEDWFWNYDNNGLRLAQLRFYEID